MRFQGRTALITAGGRGIGRATAEIIGREGGTVVAVDLDKESLDQVMGAIRVAGGTGHAIVADALDASQVAGVVRRVVEEHGRIDILVNAVGGSTIISKPSATVDELTFDEWQRLLSFNLTGTFLFTNAVVPVMKRQRGGKIVNLSSIAGRGLSATSSSALRHRQGRDHRVHPEALARARPVRHHRERDRPQPHAQPTATPALGRDVPGRARTPGGAGAAGPRGGAGGSGARHLLPRVQRRRLRHRRHHRRQRRK